MNSNRRIYGAMTILISLALTFVYYHGGWSAMIVTQTSRGAHNIFDADDARLIPKHARDNVERGSKGSRNLIAAFPSFNMPVSEAPYPSASELDRLKGGKQKAANYEDEDDFSNYNVVISAQRPNVKNGYVTEHILELNTVPLFLEALDRGTTKEGGFMGNVQIPASNIQRYWNTASLPNSVDDIFSRSMNKRVPNDRIFDVLGSTDNTNGLIIADYEINAFKTRIWQGIKPQASSKFEKYIRDWIEKGDKPDPFLRALRATRAVFSYMDISEVEEKWRDLVQYVDQQLEIIAVIPAFAKIEWGWSNFLSRFLEDRSIKARDWMRVSIKYAYTQIEKAKKNKKKIDDLDEVVEILEALEESIDDDMWLYFD